MHGIICDKFKGLPSNSQPIASSIIATTIQIRNSLLTDIPNLAAGWDDAMEKYYTFLRFQTLTVQQYVFVELLQQNLYGKKTESIVMI